MRARRSRRPSGSSELTGSSRMQQPWPGDERLGDPEPLAHPARVRRRSAVEPRRSGRPAPSVSVARARASAAREALQPAGELDQLAARSSSRSSADPGRGRRSASRSPEPSAVTGRPSIEARPAVGRASPVRSRSVVVLPAPLGPSRPKTDPAGTSRSRPSTASTPPGPPNRLVRPRHVDDGRRAAGHASSRPTAR